MANGPLQGGIGLALGTSSLIKNSFVGAFNSIHKISGSLVMIVLLFISNLKRIVGYRLDCVDLGSEVH